MDVDDTGNPDRVDRKKELLVTAFEYVSHHPDAGQVWYAALQPHELQMLSTGVGDVLYGIAHIIAALRGAVMPSTPRLRDALELIAPLIDIPIDVKD